MNGPRRWLDQPRNVTRLVWVLYAACALLLGADAFLNRHGHFEFEGWFGFYAFLGFGAYCAVVLSAKGLRRFLRRDEDYYEPAEKKERPDG